MTTRTSNPNAPTLHHSTVSGFLRFSAMRARNQELDRKIGDRKIERERPKLGKAG
jgi:hypothetical protein